MDEKSRPHPAPAPRTAKAFIRRAAADLARLFTLGLFLLSAVAFLVLFQGFDLDWKSNPPGSYNIGSDDQYWSTVKAHEDLHYEPCYEAPEMDCARLRLPMDYNQSSSSKQFVGLAIIRVPAPVPVDDPRYGGAVIVNPGGPGGSGVSFLAAAGRELQILLSDEDKYFDILSFDPRGVARSTPRALCIADESAIYPWGLRVQSVGIIGSSNVALSQLFSMSAARGAACLASEQQNTIKEHMTTAFVARDMLQLVESHGRWRERTLSEISSRATLRFIPKLLRPTRNLGFETSANQRSPYSPEQEKLQYWGFSYGTLLGATFATMFPSRIARMVLDGVVDMQSYYETRWGKDNLADTELVMQAFYDRCAAAGPSTCPLVNSNVTTPKDVQLKVSAILKSLEISPLAVTTAGAPEVITYSDVKSLIFAALYTPSFTFPLIAHILNDIYDGNGKSMARLLRVFHRYSCRDDPQIAQEMEAAAEAQITVICTDGKSIANESISDMAAHYEYLNDISPSASGVWAAIRLACTGYSLRPKRRFEGPYDGSVNTSAPILWVGNTADPVTPVRNARAGAKRFRGSGVVRIDGLGHCSISAGYSSCFIREMRRYFKNGTVPDSERVCPIEVQALEDTGSVRLPISESARQGSHAFGVIGRALSGQGLGHGIMRARQFHQ